MHCTRIIAVFVLLACVSGCGVHPEQDYRAAQQHIARATGEPDSYVPGEDHLIADKVKELLANGVTAREAVQIALLNNPTLQAGFMDVGMARADFVQSGLLSNPTLGFSFRLPEGGGRSDIETSIAQNIVEIWQIPVRKRAAGRTLQQTILSLAKTAVQLASDTKSAYWTARASEQSLVIARENLKLAKELLEVTHAREQAGAVSELDVNLVRGTVLGVELEAQNARLESDSAKRRLATLMGLTVSATDLVLADELPVTETLHLNIEGVTLLALGTRLDIRAAEEALDAAEAKVKQEYLKVFPSLEVGLALERNARRALRGRKILADTLRSSIASGGLTAPEIEPRSARRAERRAEIDTIFGPSVDLTLPIFDQNQAQIAKAKFAYEQASKNLDALGRGAVQEIVEAIDQAQTAWKVAEYYKAQLLPQAQRNLEMSRATYQAGKAQLFVLLDAERSLLATRRAYVTALQAAVVAIPELERVVGRPMEEILKAPSPASEPADEGAEHD